MSSPSLLCDVVGRRLQIVPGDTTPGSPHRRCPDMSKTIAATGYEPAVSLMQGTSSTYAWYRNRVFEGDLASAT